MSEYEKEFKNINKVDKFNFETLSNLNQDINELNSVKNAAVKKNEESRLSITFSNDVDIIVDKIRTYLDNLLIKSDAGYTDPYFT